MRLLGSIAFLCALLAGACPAGPAAAAPAPRPDAMPDSTSADSAAVETGGRRAVAGRDSTGARTEAPPGDPAYAWKRWQDLSRAIALRPLDGPEDIREKAEIIQDRLDDLRQESRKLETGLQEWTERREALGAQLEILDDMARLQRGGDLHLQQRVHALREDGREATQRTRVLELSHRQLKSELSRLEELAAQYEEQAEQLRRREEGNP